MRNDHLQDKQSSQTPIAGINYDRVYRTLIDAYLKVSTNQQKEPSQSDDFHTGGVQ